MPRLLNAARPVAATFAEQPAEGMSLADRLASLSMRLRGVADGTFSLEGTLPEAAGPDADPGARPTLKQILQRLAFGIELKMREASYDMKDLPDVESVNAYGNELFLRLKDGGDPGLILAEASAKLKVLKFEVAEPSINDIFVEQVTRS